MTNEKEGEKITEGNSTPDTASEQGDYNLNDLIYKYNESFKKLVALEARRADTSSNQTGGDNVEVAPHLPEGDNVKDKAPLPEARIYKSGIFERLFGRGRGR